MSISTARSSRVVLVQTHRVAVIAQLARERAYPYYLAPSDHEMSSSRDHVCRADHGRTGFDGLIECAQGQPVKRAHVPTRDLVQTLDGTVDGEIMISGNGTAVLEIGRSFVAGKQAQTGIVVDSLGDLFTCAFGKDFLKRRLPGEHDADHET